MLRFLCVLLVTVPFQIAIRGQAPAPGETLSESYRGSQRDNVEYQKVPPIKVFDNLTDPTPTVFADLPQDARIAREEIFGPVVVAQSFDTLDDAVRLANDSAFGLGASLWSNDLARVQRLIPRIDAGTLWINTHNMLDPNMPFGGFKQSGVGREHGRAVLDLYLEKKSVCIAY